MLDHYEIPKARLESGKLSGKVFDVVRRNDAGEFVRDNYLVYTMGKLETGASRHPQAADDNAVFVYRLRAVGTTADAVLRVLAEVDARWLGWVPQVPGRKCSSMRFPKQQDVEVQADTSVRPPLFYADVEYTLRSNRAGSGS